MHVYNLALLNFRFHIDIPVEVIKLSKLDSTHIQLGGSYDELPETQVPEGDEQVQSEALTDAPTIQEEHVIFPPAEKKSHVTLSGAQLLMVLISILFVLVAAITASGWWLAAALLYGAVTVWFAVFRKQRKPARQESVAESSPPLL